MSRMNRRSFVAGAAAVAGTMALKPGRAEAKAPRKPNLIYVFADQLRHSSVGYAGDEYARTPNMDKLAAQGCNVRQAVSSTPVCSPYRCSLMTGKYQSSTGMVINELRLSPEHECFGHVLTRAGYDTAYIGKWHMWANTGQHALIKAGFVPPGAYRLGFDDYWAAYNFNHEYFHSPYFLNNTEPHIRTDYEPDGQTNQAIAYLKDKKRKDDPFALFLSWGPPHYPWGLDNVDPKYAELYRDVDIPLAPNYTLKGDGYSDKWQRLPPNYDSKVHEWLKTYYAQVANLDWNLGRLMQTIEEQGLAEDTILVFTSDHGEMFGSHGRMAKLIFYEEAARVPFLVRWPGKIPQKTISEALLGTPDIMPSLLTMMELPVPKAVEGIDLSRQLLGKGGADNEAAHMQGMGTTAAWVDGTEWRALRDHEYTYAIYHKDRSELLFNNRKDPYQMVNLAEDRAFDSTVAHYRASSEAFRKERNDTFEACSWYQRWTEDRNLINTATGVTQDLGKLKGITDKWLPPAIGDKRASPGLIGN